MKCGIRLAAAKLWQAGIEASGSESPLARRDCGVKKQEREDTGRILLN